MGRDLASPHGFAALGRFLPRVTVNSTMDADLKKRIQITLLVFVMIAGIRVGFIFYARRDTGGGPKKPETTYSSNMDDYVTPHKIFPYNVESAKQELAVKTGNLLPYYAYDAAAHSVNFKKKAGLLPPLARLQVKDVVLQREPATLKPGQVTVVQKQVMAVFEKAGEPGTFAASFGTNTGD